MGVVSMYLYLSEYVSYGSPSAGRRRVLNALSLTVNRSPHTRHRALLRRTKPKLAEVYAWTNSRAPHAGHVTRTESSRSPSGKVCLLFDLVVISASRWVSSSAGATAQSYQMTLIVPPVMLITTFAATGKPDAADAQTREVMYNTF